MNKPAWALLLVGVLSGAFVLFGWSWAPIMLLGGASILAIFALFISMMFFLDGFTRKELEKEYERRFAEEKRKLDQRQTVIQSFLYRNSASGGSRNPEPQHGDAPEGIDK